MYYPCSIIGYFCKILLLQNNICNVFDNLPVNVFIKQEIGGFTSDVVK